MTVVRKVTAAQQAAGGDVLEYVISDGSLDRYGTVINPAGWDLTEFRKNPIAFFNHDKNFPIGAVGQRPRRRRAAHGPSAPGG
jgi:hypothetical protein